MKKCPKCGKTYDDSWSVCLSCSEKLSDDISIQPTNPELANKNLADEDKNTFKGIFKEIFWPDLSARKKIIKTIKDLGNLFYFLAGLNILIGLSLDKNIIPIGVVMAVLAYFVKRQSRVASIGILGLWMLEFIGRIILPYATEGSSPRIGFIFILIFFASINAVRATFAFHRVQRRKVNCKLLIVSGASILVISTIIAFVLPMEQMSITYGADTADMIFGIMLIVFVVGLVSLLAGIVVYILNKINRSKMKTDNLTK